MTSQLEPNSKFEYRDLFRWNFYKWLCVQMPMGRAPPSEADIVGFALSKSVAILVTRDKRVFRYFHKKGKIMFQGLDHQDELSELAGKTVVDIAYGRHNIVLLTDKGDVYFCGLAHVRRTLNQAELTAVAIVPNKLERQPTVKECFEGYVQVEPKYEYRLVRKVITERLATKGSLLIWENGIRAIRCGYYFTALLTYAGRVVVFGDNLIGGSVVPSMLNDLGISDVVAIEAGAFFLAMLTSSGRVAIWIGDERHNVGLSSDSSPENTKFNSGTAEKFSQMLASNDDEHNSQKIVWLDRVLPNPIRSMSANEIELFLLDGEGHLTFFGNRSIYDVIHIEAFCEGRPPTVYDHNCRFHEMVRNRLDEGVISYEDATFTDVEAVGDLLVLRPKMLDGQPGKNLMVMGEYRGKPCTCAITACYDGSGKMTSLNKLADALAFYLKSQETKRMFHSKQYLRELQYGPTPVYSPYLVGDLSVQVGSCLEQCCQLLVHRDFIITVSDFIRSVVDQSPCDAILILSGRPYSTFKAFFYYLYTGHLLVDISLDDVLELLDLAIELDDSDLREVCIDWLLIGSPLFSYEDIVLSVMYQYRLKEMTMQMLWIMNGFVKVCCGSCLESTFSIRWAIRSMLKANWEGDYDRDVGPWMANI